MLCCLLTGQDHAGGDVCVLEQLEGDEAVVLRGLGVRQDLAQLGQVRGAEEVRYVNHRRVRQCRDRRWVHLRMREMSVSL